MDQSLWIKAVIINGEYITSKKLISVVNPYDLSVIGEVPSLSEKQILEAIESANKAFTSWSKKTAKERSKLLRAWYDLIIEHQDDLAEIMTLEQGKILAESKAEIIYAASFIEWFSEEAKRVYGQVIPSPLPDTKMIVQKQPVGVCTAITPWNFPAAMITRKAGAALAAGCTMVVKPASATPFTALALGELALRAGIEPGVLNVITGDAAMIGRIFATHPAIRKLSFTGSTAVGKNLMRQASDQVKRLSLELGGNAPFMVCADADLSEAAKGLMASKFRNSGQTCICANRVFVHASVYESFIKEISKHVSQLVCGNGLDKTVTQGPLINKAALDKVDELLHDAVKNGAKIVIGGKREKQCYQPTIIRDVTSRMAITKEEIFGPVISLIAYQTDEELIQQVNDTPYGLAAYIYSQNWQHAWYLAEAIECGMVAINKGVLSTEVAPFGGVKESGFGREGASVGIDEYLNIKYMLLAYSV